MKWLLRIATMSIGVALAAQTGGHETRLEVQTPPTMNSEALAISPDGDKIAFVAASGARYPLWVHSLSSGKSQPLSGTEDVGNPTPCWSVDGKSLAYFSIDQLKRIDVETGAIKTLTPGVPRGRGCSWGRDGTILFGVGSGRVIYRISDEGGEPQPATSRDVYTVHSPQFLPDGRHFLYYVVGDGVVVGNTGGGEPQKLLSADSFAVYSRTGHLLFVRQGALYAQVFDAETLKVSGAPFLVARGIQVGANRSPIAASATGDIVFRAGEAGGRRQFKWFDRTGKEAGSVGGPMVVAGSPLVLSPDGKMLTLGSAQDGNTDVWILDLATGKPSRLTEAPGLDLFPIWSADSRNIYFTSNSSGVFELYERPASGVGEEKLVMLAPRKTRQAKDVSRDGRFLLYTTSDGGNIWGLQLDGNPRGEFPLVQSAGLTDFPQFAPDGRWFAYQSNESGRFEVYLQQFPSGRKLKVSANGGGHARWRPDGKEMFYVGLDGQLMSITIALSADVQDVQFGTPTALFTPSTASNVANITSAPMYVVSPDGQRFLMATVEEVRSPITVIRNWQPKP